jgi:pimeloyl-ACP methyl ester carboxylesterase
MWRHLVPALAADRRVLVPDLRGHGRSDAPDGDYRKHVFVDDLLALLDAEGIERAAVVGHDWGGWAAWLAALEHPQRITRFVGIDIPPPWIPRQAPKGIVSQLRFASYQYFISMPFLGERLVRAGRPVREILTRGSGRAMSWTDEEIEAYVAPLREPARARASVHLYRTFLLREVPAIAAGRYTKRRLSVPGLAIMGAESAITRMIWDPRPQPNLEVEVVEGAGHFVPEERPDEVAALVRAFLG